MSDDWDDDEYTRQKAFDILEEWGERFPDMKAYFSRAKGGVDTFHLIIAVDEAFGEAFDRAADYILSLHKTKATPIRHPTTGGEE